MHQPRNEPVPDEGVDVPKVRPQGAMCFREMVGEFAQFIAVCRRLKMGSMGT